MSFGLTYDGFIKKTGADVKAEIEAKLKTAFGDDISLIPQSVFGVFVGIMSEERALHWEEMEAIYNAMYPSTAQGSSLSNVVQFAGISRQLGETDSELRSRYSVSVTARGRNNADSLFSQLIQLADVMDALVLENKTDVTDANGIPPHQFLTVVQGGTNAEIAQIVWDNTPQGIGSYGAISEIVTDAQGDGQTVYFSRPTAVPIYLIINVLTNSFFPVDGVAQVQTNVQTFGTDTFLISDDVVFTRFYSPINQVAGVIDIEMFIGTSPTPTGQINIPIAITEIASFDIANIEVNVS